MKDNEHGSYVITPRGKASQPKTISKMTTPFYLLTCTDLPTQPIGKIKKNTYL